jgi:tetratricopeptide (TPR) repeat protein
MSTKKEARRTLLSILLVGLATTHIVCAEETNKSSQLPLSSDCNVAALYMWLGNDAQTYKYLDAALKKNPKDAMACLFRGKEHVWHAEYKLALSDFQRAIQLGCPRIDGLERIAYCYFVSGQIQQGIDVCTEILRLDPHSHMAYENRAKGFALLKKPDLEREDLIALKSTSLSSVEYLGLSYKEKDATFAEKRWRLIPNTRKGI